MDKFLDAIFWGQITVLFLHKFSCLCYLLKGQGFSDVWIVCLILTAMKTHFFPNSPGKNRVSYFKGDEEKSFLNFIFKIFIKHL